MTHKILIVDDERTTVALVKFGLAGQGYEVITANDGQEALTKVEAENPDLIVLDVQMPNMSGYEFMGELKQRQGIETTPVIMLTANETMQDIFKLEGVKGYFVKPVDISKLVENIEKCLGPNTIDWSS